MSRDSSLLHGNRGQHQELHAHSQLSRSQHQQKPYNLPSALVEWLHNLQTYTIDSRLLNHFILSFTSTLVFGRLMIVLDFF